MGSPCPGQLLQVPGDSSSVRGQQLAGNGPQPMARQIEVGVADSGPE